MQRFLRLAGALAATLVAVMWIMPAQAQATRTWVSGVGDDANPCSRTAPCKTFAGAISKTAVNGVINCLDPGGFGAVTITKSIALICQFTEGGITNPSSSGITVNAAGGVVYLKGIDLEGIVAGVNGVNVVNASAVHVIDCTIRGNVSSSPNGNGILFQPNGAASLYVVDSYIADNGTGTGNSATGNGILIQPQAGGSAVATIEHTRLANNANGIALNSTNGTVAATITNSVIAGGAIEVGAVANNGNKATIVVKDSVVQNGSVYGLFAVGSGAQIGIGGSQLSGNGQDVSTINSGVAVTYGDNEINGNTVNGSFTATVTKG